MTSMFSTFGSLEANSINSTKYTWLDFNSFFGLDFSAIPVYLCEKITLNNEFKSSKLTLFFFFNHGKDNDSSKAEYFVTGSPLNFYCGAGDERIT